MKKVNTQSGQSTIEFLLGFSIMFMLILLLLKVSFQYTNGYFLHYATYMASRTYMVVDVNDAETLNDQIAEKRARTVFAKFNVSALIPSFTSNLTFRSPDFGGNRVFSGLYAEYKEKFSPIKMIGGDSEVNFRSESFLRREPGREACLKQTCKAMEELGVSCGIHVTYFDNGC